jgi:hypothetical protein
MVHIIINKYFQCCNGSGTFVLEIVFLFIHPLRRPDKWPKHVAGYSNKTTSKYYCERDSTDILLLCEV